MELIIYIILGLILGVLLTIVIKGFMPEKNKKNKNTNKKGKIK